MKKRLVIRKSINMEGKGDNTTLESLKKKTGISSDELKKQYAMGIKVEAEHTKDKKVAHQIAMDHMEEDIYYYKKLKDAGIADELEKSIMQKAKYTSKKMVNGKWKYFYGTPKEKNKTEDVKGSGRDKTSIDTVDHLKNKWKEKGVSLSISGKGDTISLDMIKVAPDARGKGYAKSAMSDLISLADKNNQTVTLTPSVDMGSNKNKLISFYKTFGFVENKGKNRDYEYSDTMYRSPGMKKSVIDWSDRLRRLFIRKHGSPEDTKQLEAEDKESKAGPGKLFTRGDLLKIANGSTEYDRKYKLQGRTNWNGLDIAIENKKGSYRTGKDIDGKPWKTLMSYDYGRITGTKATDSEAVDIYLGPDETADRVYVVHQVDPFKNYAYDECKVMANFPSKESAIKGYQSQYNRPDFLGEVSEFTIPDFKQALIDNKGKMLYKSPILLESKDDKKPKRLVIRRK